MNNRTNEYRVGVGASSILMIFIILSLTTLSILSFASARSDLTLTDKRKAQVEAYYQAEAKVQGLLSEIDLQLMDTDPEGYERTVRSLTALDPSITVAEDLLVTMQVPVGAAQALRVTIAPLPEGSGARYRMVGHALLNTEEWAPDESMGELASPPQP